MGNYKYKAFISYSHKDDRWGRWLHRRLETYPLPRNIVGNVTETGPIPRRLKPIFRDREELAAADNLGDKIEQALENSENLIMICSPAAARSHWVNQEILYFKRHNRGAQIFSVIVEGEPFASNMPGREAEECFPPALRYQLDEKGALSNIPAEPLAADLRDHADGKRLGVLKLVSGMIGVGLDEVVQRDMRRGRRRVTAITTGALATVLAMGTLTGFALDARSEAEQRRNDAEENIEFMITDLKDELEKVGRLDALKVVGQRAKAYYDKYPISDHTDEALGRRARVFHYLGEIQDKSGNLHEANRYFKQAYGATKTLLARDKENPQRIFEHSQSAFWAGYIPYRREQFMESEKYFLQYSDLSQQLIEKVPNQSNYTIELAASYLNLGANSFGYKGYEKAIEEFRKSILVYAELVESYPENINARRSLADAHGWQAKTYDLMGQNELSRHHRLKEIEIAENLLNFLGYEDWETIYIIASSYRGLARTAFREYNYKGAVKHCLQSETLFKKLLSNDISNAKWALGAASTKLMLQISYESFGETIEASNASKELDKILAHVPEETRKTKTELTAQLDLNIHQ